MIERKMTEINISSLIKNEVETSTHLKNLILNINVKSPKIFSNLFHIFIFVSFAASMLTSAIIFLQLQELQTQMHSFMLMCQDKDNRSNHVEASNRVQRSVDYNVSVSPIVSSTFKLSNQMEVGDDRHTDAVISLMRYNQIVSDRSTHESNAIKRNASGVSNVARSLNKLMIYNLFSDFNEMRKIRRSETQHDTATEREMSDRGLIVWSKSRAGMLQRMKRNSEERQSEEKDETQRHEVEGEERRQSREEGVKRLSEENVETRLLQSEEEDEKRRSEGKSKTRRQTVKKGEKRRQNRRGHKRNRRRSRPLVATFVGATPEELKDTVYIGPWVKTKIENHQYDLTKFHLVENNMSIQVGINGLYMISVQIYYFGHAMNYSYWILLNSEGSSMKRKLVTCATASFNNEASCYTSIIIYLQKGDRLSLQQQEKNRLINMQDGYSQIQIMLLANDRKRFT